jgi:hypothetical protein
MKVFSTGILNFDTIKVITTDYHELLASKEIDFIYCAVQHKVPQDFADHDISKQWEAGMAE